MRQRGFTLIEILVVITIISILTSVVYAAVGQTRLKARDGRRQADIHSISNALALFYLQNNKYPGNYNCYNGSTHVLKSGGCSNGGSVFGVCDGPVPGLPGGTDTNNFPAAYNASMQELVDAGVLSSIPHDPSGVGYCYYDFGPGLPSGSVSPPGAIFLTLFEAAPPSSSGLAPSCRPWPPLTPTWCAASNSLEYCLCNQY